MSNSLITDGAKIEGTVINSIVGSSVVIKKGAVIQDSVIFANTVIGEDSIIEYSIIDENVIIGKLIPGGTGMKRYQNIHINTEKESE